MVHRRRSVWLLAPALLTASNAEAGPRDWASASDVGRDILVVASLGIPAAKGDWRGDLQAGESLLATGAATWTLKELIHERRPDRSDNRSFPSGHTSISFASAVMLEKRYGWQYGLPALALAGFVGGSRVAADKHYVHDVLAGAAIGGAAGYLFTSRQNDRVRLIPWAESHGGGFTMAARW